MVSASTKHPVLASALIWVTRLCAAPIGSEIQSRERVRETERKKGEWGGAILFLHLHQRQPKRGRECVCSAYSSQTGTTFKAEPTQPPTFTGSYLNRNYWSCALDSATLSWSWGWCFLFAGNVLTGVSPEDPWLPGADRLAPFQVQDADSEGQTRHYAADGQRGGGLFRRHGWTERRGASQCCDRHHHSWRQAASSTPLCGHGEWENLWFFGGGIYSHRPVDIARMCVHVCISCSISPFLHIPLTPKVTPRIPVGPLRFLCASFNKTAVRLVILDLYHINACLIISVKIRFFSSTNLFFSTIKVTVTVMTVQFIYKIKMSHTEVAEQQALLHVQLFRPT